MHDIIDMIVGIVDKLGYIGIYIMMTLESSFIPFPSEVAMVPAGFLIADGRMNLWLAFGAGTLWALTGASINYFLWKHLGKPIVQKLIHKYGKYIFLNEAHYQKSEKYFEKHGSITTLYTAIWAGTWNAILIGIGYIAWENKELIKTLKIEAVLILLVALSIIVFWYIRYVKSQAKKLRKIEETIVHNDEKALKKAQKLVKKSKKK